jgi:hypothetical protein
MTTTLSFQLNSCNLVVTLITHSIKFNARQHCETAWNAQPHKAKLSYFQNTVATSKRGIAFDKGPHADDKLHNWWFVVAGIFVLHCFPQDAQKLPAPLPPGRGRPLRRKLCTLPWWAKLRARLPAHGPFARLRGRTSRL